MVWGRGNKGDLGNTGDDGGRAVLPLIFVNSVPVCLPPFSVPSTAEYCRMLPDVAEWGLVGMSGHSWEFCKNVGSLTVWN